MWGNRLGWIIAIVLSASILAPVGWIVRAGRLSAPTGIGLDPENFKPIALPLAPDTAWPIFTDDGDAGPVYARVIDAWNDDAEAAARQFARAPAGELPEPINLLVAARHLKTMTLFAADLTELINYDSEHPKLDKLFAAGAWCCRIGMSLSLHGRPDDATACLEAAFALGRQLFVERIVYDECQKGMTLMSDAATARKPGLDEFALRLEEYQTQRLIPIWQTISSVDPDVLARSAGDVAALATRSPERLWRVEATLKLGEFRFNAGSIGDQTGAARLLRTLSADPDPAVALAATTALKLDIETYRMIH
jgi:hypothetical protein